jgi:hypothetical protein
MNLINTKVADLGPLNGLTALQWIALDRTEVADLTAVQDLPKLQTIIGAATSEMRRLTDYRARKGLPHSDTGAGVGGSSGGGKGD